MARSAHIRRRDDSDVEEVGSSQPQRRATQNDSDDEMEDVQDASQSSAPSAERNSKNKGKGRKRAATPLDDGSEREVDADQDLQPFDPVAFRDQPIPGRASEKFGEIFQMWHKGITPLNLLEKQIREAATALTEAGDEGNPEVCTLISLEGYAAVADPHTLPALLKHSLEFTAHRHLRRRTFLCANASI